MRTVKDILRTKAKPFNQVSAGTLVIDALKMLNSINLSYLVVMDDDEYKGIFSERDYSRNVILKGRHSDSTTVSEVMTQDVPVVELDKTVEQCMHLIDQHKTRYLLAFDKGGDFAGVITIHDLLRQVINDKEAVFDKTLAERLVDDEEGGRIY
jgi:CBS domain-containing protein